MVSTYKTDGTLADYILYSEKLNKSENHTCIWLSISFYPDGSMFLNFIPNEY